MEFYFIFSCEDAALQDLEILNLHFLGSHWSKSENFSDHHIVNFLNF